MIINKRVSYSPGSDLNNNSILPDPGAARGHGPGATKGVPSANEHNTAKSNESPEDPGSSRVRLAAV